MCVGKDVQAWVWSNLAQKRVLKTAPLFDWQVGNATVATRIYNEELRVGMCVCLRGQMGRDWLLFHSIWITDRHIDTVLQIQTNHSLIPMPLAKLQLNKRKHPARVSERNGDGGGGGGWWWGGQGGRICMSLSPPLPMIHLSGPIENHAVAVWVCARPEETCLVLSVPLSLQWQCNICLFCLFL